MLKKLTLSLLTLALLAPSAFADTVEELTIVEEESELCGCGGDYYGSNEVYFTVNTTTTVEADRVYMYGSYTVENASTRKEAVQELRDVYEAIQESVGDYGTVRRTSIYTYMDWEYTNLYDASLSIRVDLTDFESLTTVEDMLYEAGFDNWYEAVVMDTTAAEGKVAKAINTMIESKKEVYEEILGYQLGKVDGLSLYSWPDSSTFDSETGLVEVMVSASVWYYKD